MADRDPLTPPQRRQIVAIVAEVDADLADALSSELELDPTVRLLLRGIEGIRDQAASDARETRTELLSELRATRWQVIGVVVLALVIQAGMVGLSLSIQGPGPLPSIEVLPAIAPPSRPAQPAPAIDTALASDGDDGEVFVGDSLHAEPLR